MTSSNYSRSLLCCIAAVLVLLVNCSETEFGSDAPVASPPVTGAPPSEPAVRTGGGDSESSFGDIIGNDFPERNLEEEQSDITSGMMVPLKIYYDGEFSGSDAQFTFYVARVSPMRDRKEVEVIKSVRKQFIEASQPNFCKCGKKNEMYFMWRHVRGRAGALHTRTEGEWMVSHDVSDEKWKSKDLKSVSSGLHTYFLGADTENPNFLFDPTGNGFFRTDSYAPNSVFGNARKWGHRDDMRLAISCDVSQCPEDAKAGTELELIRHTSMNP
jgi:hypothetical protein